jgi:hypothetical protein
MVIVPSHYLASTYLSLLEIHCCSESRTKNSMILDSFWLVIAHIPSYNSILSSRMHPMATASRLENYHLIRLRYECDIIPVTGYIALTSIFSRWFRFRFLLWVSFMSRSFSLSTLLLLFLVVPNVNFYRHFKIQSLSNLWICSSLFSVNLF